MARIEYTRANDLDEGLCDVISRLQVAYAAMTQALDGLEYVVSREDGELSELDTLYGALDVLHESVLTLRGMSPSYAA